MILLPLLNRYKRRTKADGNCAFHAVFGEWNACTEEYEDLKVTIHKNKFIESIRSLDINSELYLYVENHY